MACAMAMLHRMCAACRTEASKPGSRSSEDPSVEDFMPEPKLLTKSHRFRYPSKTWKPRGFLPEAIRFNTSLLK